MKFLLFLLGFTVFLLPVLGEEELTEADFELFLQELEDAERQLRLSLLDLPRDSFEISAVIDHVGEDPELLLDWVSQYTQYVPYQGIVRGSFGVLQDRIGNHWDRALLLSSLLEAVGFSTKLEILDKEGFEGFIAPESLNRDLRPDRIALSNENLELLEMIAPGSLEALDMRRQFVPRNLFGEALQARAFGLFNNFLNLEGIPDTPQNQLQELDPQIRVWWQAEEDSSWQTVNLASGSRNKINSMPATGVYSAKEAEEKFGFTADIEVFLERWVPDSGSREVVSIVSGSFLVHQMRMQQLAVAVLSLDLTTEDFYHGETKEEVIAEFKKDLTENSEWIVVLNFEGEPEMSPIIQRDGQLRNTAEPTVARAMGDAAGAIGRIGIGRRPAEPEKPQDLFMGLDLKITLSRGEEVVHEVRRPWFSFSDPEDGTFAVSEENALERAVGLMRDTRVIFQTAEISEPLISGRILGGTLHNLRAFNGIISSWEDGNFDNLQVAMAQSDYIPGSLIRFAKERFAGSLIPETVYLGEPNILIEHSGMTISDQLMGEYYAVDLAYVPLLLYGNPSLEEQRVAFLKQGILETVLEGKLLSLWFEEAGLDTGLRIENAAWTTESSGWSGTGGSWILPEQMEILESLDMDRITSKAIADLLERGHLLYFPLIDNLESFTDEQLVYWGFDPDSGRVLGYGKHGWGMGFTEYLMNMAHMLHAKYVLLKMSLASKVGTTAGGTFAACGFAAATVALWLFSEMSGTGNELADKAISHVGGKAQGMLRMCFEGYNKWMNPTRGM